MSELLKLDEYAGSVGVHSNTVHKWLREGRIAGTKVGKSWRIAPDARPVAKGEKVTVEPAQETVSPETATVVAGDTQSETLNELGGLVNSGKATESQEDRYTYRVGKLQKIGAVAVLRGLVLPLDELLRREQAVLLAEDVAEREKAAIETNELLTKREQAVGEREATRSKKQREQVDLEKRLNERKAALDSKERELATREKAVVRGEKALARRGKALSPTEKKLEKRELAVGERESQVAVLEERNRADRALIDAALSEREITSDVVD
tara:strand:+ start:82 stop:882 length:801 start_codon:yes stop_codon:yes gene_type:complete